VPNQITRQKPGEEVVDSKSIRRSAGIAARITRPDKGPKIAMVFGLSLVAASSACDRGSFNPDVTQETIGQTICVAGYTEAVRPPVTFTNRVKQTLLTRAGYDHAEAFKYKLHHIIPVALGGHPRKLENLGLERRDGASSAKRKKRIEAKLQCLVCTGQVTLADAQQEISTDWQAADNRYAKVACQRRMVDG
jgi:cytochrome c-type biogenesis protein CcmH/NrfF